ncbi:activating signal cointegrator 1 complex subunit 1-like [Artemia franciscana]|uniref:K Homology domain-containing protein n=1 Tax=Artemia franciscana TaxID=6661 RepID=A0AA88HXR8_ARTSF|nr:hypothetical protein QYM36_004790 [Artemia franciscana]KAK2719078.1 hypothetical protein QYM36_004790 [Artemia franciscana]
MDVLNPETRWIQGACFRINPIHSDYAEGGRGPRRTFNEENEGFTPYEDEPCEDLSGIVKTKDGYSLSLSIPSAYFPYIIGAKGATRKRIETETGTRIKIPGQGREGDVIIQGDSIRSIISVNSRLEIIISTARQKQPFTHFISIPFTSPEIQSGFLRFQQQVLHNCQDRGIEPDLFQTPAKLHLTIGTLVLLNEAERKSALTELRKCDDILSGPVEVSLEGIEYMNDDPSEVDVLYACVTGSAAEQLQELSDTIVDRMCGQGLMTRQYDRVRLHVTVMNTLFRSSKGDVENEVETKGNEVRRPRESFDAKNILKNFKNFEFGTQIVDSVHLSQRYSAGKDGYYVSAGQLEIV